MSRQFSNAEREVVCQRLYEAGKRDGVEEGFELGLRAAIQEFHARALTQTFSAASLAASSPKNPAFMHVFHDPERFDEAMRDWFAAEDFRKVCHDMPISFSG